MARRSKPLIYVFWEGETEREYTKFLKSAFEDVAVIKNPPNSGLFIEAERMFKNNARYRNNIGVTDEIWFFFDTEIEKAQHWDGNYQIIKRLRRLHKRGIKVRLLMTTACAEYWLLLHYERVRPSIVSPADKARIKENVKRHIPLYEKGDFKSTCEIARNYETAIENGKWTLVSLVDDGLPTREDNDTRNRWLYQGTHTFTTVHEAIEFLIGLKR